MAKSDKPTTTDFLNKALAAAVTFDDVSALLANKVHEDHLLDYKSGAWATEQEELDRANKKEDKDPARRLRKYISGFANSDGGALVLGVVGSEAKIVEKRWTVDGLPTPPSVGWAKWASDVLKGLSGYLSRQPIITPVNHPGGELLVVAVPRSVNLIPCLEGGDRGGKLNHYVRIGDQTEKIPEYLYADLVLGRRQSPRLGAKAGDLEPGQPDIHIWLTLTFYVSNESLVWVPQLQVGVIGFTIEWALASMISVSERAVTVGQSGAFMAEALKPYLAVQFTRPPGMIHQVITSQTHNIAPLSTREFRLEFGMPRKEKDQHEYWKGALYLAPSNGLPQWFALTVDFYFEETPDGPVLHANSLTVPVQDEPIPVSFTSTDDY
jgi:hypothetical protein